MMNGHMHTQKMFHNLLNPAFSRQEIISIPAQVNSEILPLSNIVNILPPPLLKLQKSEDDSQTKYT